MSGSRPIASRRIPVLCVMMSVGTLAFHVRASELCAQSVGQSAILDQRVQLLPAVILGELDGNERSRLAQIEDLIDNGQWSDAVESSQAMIDQSGNRLIDVSRNADESFRRFVPVRFFCHGLLCAKGSQSQRLLDAYRQRVDPLARRWYQEAIERRDASMLSEIIARFFASTHGDDALLALGEIALGRAHYSRARYHWSRIIPGLRASLDDRLNESVPRDPLGDAAYPDSGIPKADVLARLVLASVLEGAHGRARDELRYLEQINSNPTGVLGGREVNYVAALKKLLDESKEWPTVSRRNSASHFWQPNRSGRVAANLDRLLITPIWSVRLSGLFSGTPLPRSVDGEPAEAFQRGECPFHVTVAGDTLLLANSERLVSIDVRDGKSEEIYPRGILVPRPEPPGLPRIGMPQFVLQADGPFLVARFGNSVTTYALRNNLPSEQGYLLGWNLESRRLMTNRLRPGGPRWAFDGTPIADEDRLFITMRYTDVEPQTQVACFEARTGRLIWRTPVSAANSPGQGYFEEVTHNLLVLREGTLYLNTNAGVVVALSSGDGAIEWLTRYPRISTGALPAGQAAQRTSRWPNPCLVHRDTVYVCPSDSHHVFALDAFTGTVLWNNTLRQSAAKYTMGVNDGQLILGGERIWWLDARSGKLSKTVTTNPFPMDVAASGSGVGRGTISGSLVFWTARGEKDWLYVADAKSGSLVAQPLDLTTIGAEAGNAVCAHDRLFITGATSISGFQVFPR